jgi:type VI secretion system protein VasD
MRAFSRFCGGGQLRIEAWLPMLAAALVFAAPAAHAAKVKVKGELATAADLNPDYRGRPSPIVLIVFQLTAADAFQNADFFSLYDPDAAVLGGDLLDRSQMMLQPGDARPFEAEFDEEARYIGVVAAFRDIENAQWRGLVELPQKGFFRNFFSRSKFLIELEALALSVSLE